MDAIDLEDQKMWGLSFEYKSYKRLFAKPLQLKNRLWESREGVVLRLTYADGKVRFSEIAVLPEFGTETLNKSIDWLKAQKGLISKKVLESDQLQSLPCTKTALSFLLNWKSLPLNTHQDVPLNALLPSGVDAIGALEEFQRDGYTCFKWKMGIYPFKEETEILKKLCSSLDKNQKIRLDANAGLSLEEAQAWLAVLEDLPIEFLEQPLAVDQLGKMLTLSNTYQTPIALDESVKSFDDCIHIIRSGWSGPLVIKPSTIGDIFEFYKWRETCPCPLIYSTVFETAIGENLFFQIAASDTTNSFAIGCTPSWLFSNDGMGIEKKDANFSVAPLSSEELNCVWNLI